MDGAPGYAYSYGNTESGVAFTIDVWADGEDRYQARAWLDGDTSDIAYFDSFEKCVAWFRTFTNEMTIEHGLPALGLAPQWDSEAEDWGWVLYDASNVDDWWTGSDFENAPHPEFIRFDDMIEDLEFAARFSSGAEAAGPKPA